MSHPARGPVLTGIDGKANAATSRIDAGRISTCRTEASRMSHPARGPVLTGIDGKANADKIWQLVSNSVTSHAMTVLLLAAILAGCRTTHEPNAQREHPWYPAVVDPAKTDTELALKYYERVLKLKGADLLGELEAGRRNFEQEASDLHRVELAMVLGLPGAPFRDDNAALALLQPLARGQESADATLRPLALLLHTWLTDLRRADESLQQQITRAKEEQRRADALQQKLDAILEMEMKMIEREQALPPKSR
jgi:hypothetical protein